MADNKPANDKVCFDQKTKQNVVVGKLTDEENKALLAGLFGDPLPKFATENIANCTEAQLKANINSMRFSNDTGQPSKPAPKTR